MNLKFNIRLRLWEDEGREIVCVCVEGCKKLASNYVP